MSARTSRSGLLPGAMVCGDDDISSILRQSGPKRHSLGDYSSLGRDDGKFSLLSAGNNVSGSAFNRQPLSAVPRGLTNGGERSSDSDDSRSGSGATSGKEASPGYEESSGSEQSSGAPTQEDNKEEEPSSTYSHTNGGGSLGKIAMPRSKTSPALNGGWGIDDALRPLSQFTPDAAVGNGDVRIGNGYSRMRAAHEVNMSKLAYLEALFQRAKLEEMRLKGFSSKGKAESNSNEEHNAKVASPDSGYKSFPPQKNPTSGMKSSVSGPSLSTIAQSPAEPNLPDGQALLRTIENRLHQAARAQEQGPTDARKNFYQTGGSCSAGSLSLLVNHHQHNKLAPSVPPRYTSPSRPIDIAPSGGAHHLNSASSSPGTGSGVKRPDVLGGRLTQGMPRSLPHSYRSRSAYSSPAVSPQRGPDPSMLISPSITASVNKRFSSLEARGRAERRGLSIHLPLLRHTAHGFPTSILPMSPPSPAQGAQALHQKMQLFLDIMESQSKFSKDLQSEIESHKDVLASLNATGQKLLGTLENQDDAVLLHRRLDEMNHRWNTLKFKSIAIRNRLEGTAENWNSLLLSLRELIEWVIRKDTELTGLGPLVGDVNMLAKYEEDLTSFRRFLDEKQPVIESNLKSGRQLIASEPPLSDTSDSEAGREVDGDARYRGEENTRELVRAVRREVAKLSEKWATLWERAANMAAQVSLAHKKLGVLQKTLEDVGSRLEESEKVVATWGPIPHDTNLADQHVHNVRKFRENIADLQRGIDDVNDQAARFSAHNIPLTPINSAALHDLNNRWKNLETTVNDRWRQVAGRSREVTPLTPAQLASSVNPPWERATASNKVPYYINHSQETTHWDHPIMMDLLDSLADFNHIKFSAYRTAAKLRSLQKKLSLDRAKLQLVTDVFDEHGLRGQNDRLIDVNDMIVVLSTLYGRISADHIDVNTTISTDLCLNWLLNVYDSQRTGQIRVLSFRVGLICLCRGHLEEKYRYMFRLIADPNRLVDQRKLGLLLHDCVQVPRQLGEVAAFGGSNIEPSVRSCFTKAGKDRESIEAVHFLTWVQQEPQSLVWLAVLHRVAASESVQHQVKCNICKTYPITGLRYRCLKCLSFDMCQRCFFDGRSSKSHKITHPMHEYCTATTAGDEMKDFTKALKNKFKSKRSLQKHTKKGYLPVQTVLEGDPLESPSPSPSHNVASQDMHSRLELYASRLAEVELRTNSNSTPDSEDEHGLIAQYCQSLSSSDAPFPVPKSPLQIMASVDADQKDELEQMIRDLEEENQALQAEYERLKSQQPTGSADDGMGQRSEAEMLAEAKLLREHKGRLEARMSILEDHNRQLEAQLQRLRQLLVEQQGGMGSPNKSGTLQTKSVTASQLAMDSPAKINGHSSQGGMGSSYDGLDQMSEYVRPPPPPVGNIAHMGNLYSRAAPYRGPTWRPGEGSWQSGGLNEPREGERLA